jgi:pimeloyl-ACP methyl ester carboxylesterase
MSGAYPPIAGSWANSDHGFRRSLPAPSGLRHPFAAMASAAALVLATLTFIPAAAQSATRTATRETEISRPHVYLMRGLLNIFSLGMDQLAAQIASRGIDATVYNHTVEDAVVGEIVQKYRAGDHGPYILVGHSLGADAVMVMAQQLNARDVPVALVVPFDGTGSYLAPKNVACVLNVTQRQYAYMRAGPGFHGKLQNDDVSADTSIDHFTIDKSPRLQAVALNSVLQAAHSQSCRPAVTGPAVAQPKDAPLPKETVAPKEMPSRSASPVLHSGYEG